MRSLTLFAVFGLITVYSVSAQLNTNVASVKADIVSRHNAYRSSVSPTAADMRKMEWSDAAGQMAQTWANRCDYEHSPDSHRPGCGENLAASAGTAGSWAAEAIDPWADERHDYTFGQTSMTTGWWNPKASGHWTAMIWGNSYQVGCGYKLCPGSTSPFGGSSWHYYVCSYCPAGNMHDGNGLKKPYRSGASCSACPTGWTPCDNNVEQVHSGRDNFPTRHRP